MSLEQTIAELTTTVKAQNETMHELTLAIRELITALGAAKPDSEPAKRRKSSKVEVQAAETPAVAETVEAPKVEAPKVEAPKVEAPKVEAPKVEAEETPKVEAEETPKVEATSVAQDQTDAPTQTTAETSDAQNLKEKASEYAQKLKDEAIAKAKELVATNPGHIHHLKALLVKYNVGKMSDLPLDVVPDFYTAFTDLVKALENDIL